MKAETLTLQETLGGVVRFLIPVYQRPYVWDQDHQWEPLWSDIEATAMRLAEARENGAQRGLDVAGADKLASPHFLGAIVTQQTDTALGTADERLVVDGQQRLTTLQLLLRGALEALDELEVNKTLRARVRKLIRNDDELVSAGQILKLRPRLRDTAAFANAMDSDVVNASDSNFADARAFFAEASRAFLLSQEVPEDPFSQDEVPTARRASLLVATLMGLVKLVSIRLEDVDDPQIIFEALNARNTPLTASDLVKNLLFMRAQAEHQDPEEVHARHWQRFDEASEWWGEKTGIGHAQRPRQDWLLGDWMTAQRGRSVNVGQLYSEFRSWIDVAGLKAVEALSELNEYADAFEMMHGRRPGATAPEMQAFARIDRLQITATQPLLLWLLVQPADVLPIDERELAVRAIESFVMRRMAAKEQTRNYGTVFVDVLKIAMEAPSHPGHAVIAELRNSPGGAAWTSTEDLVAEFREGAYYGPRGIAQFRLRLLLGAIDARLQETSTKAEPAAFDYDKLEIEHVIPQGWEATWPVTVEDRLIRSEAEHERARHINRIGNLTLVTGSLNRGLTNDPWAAKRIELSKHSRLVLNSLLVENERWDEEQINRRSKWLALRVDELWPGPDATVWGQPAGSGP